MDHLSDDPHEGLYADPLGMSSGVVDIDTLPRWNKSQVPDYDMANTSLEEESSPFTYDEKLNEKIILWSGDLARLNATAIVHSTNESMTDKSALSDRMYSIAGPELRQEVRALRGCKTGEAKMTQGYNLPARFVMHTVGPRYNLKYKTAAESALFCCYRNVMQIVREHGLRSVAFSSINSIKRGYPPEDGAHIAIRTVRRFLEKHGSTVETVVFAITETEEEIFIKTLPLYFPRSKGEAQYARDHLPSDVGNEDGEPVIPERQIRILDKPTIKAHKLVENQDNFETSVNINEEFQSSVAVGRHAFAQMEGDHDQSRKAVLHGRTSEEATKLEQQRRYDRWIKRARKEDLTEIAALRFIYQSGVDKLGRPVIVLIGANFPAVNVDLEKALLYFIHILDPVVNSDYIIIYFHTMTTPDNQLEFNFMKQVYNLLDYKYKKNLKSFFIIHPTFWSKVVTWFFTTFTASTVKTKVHSLPGIEYLYSKISPEQLDIPQFILEHDLQINGTHYYNPDDHVADHNHDNL